MRIVRQSMDDGFNLRDTAEIIGWHLSIALDPRDSEESEHVRDLESSREFWGRVFNYPSPNERYKTAKTAKHCLVLKRTSMNIERKAISLECPWVFDLFWPPWGPRNCVTMPCNIWGTSPNEQPCRSWPA